jgi:hypothetical protein
MFERVGGEELRKTGREQGSSRVCFTSILQDRIMSLFVQSANNMPYYGSQQQYRAAASPQYTRYKRIAIRICRYPSYWHCFEIVTVRPYRNRGDSY